MQLLRSHARATMPPKGMWSKSMKLKNILIIAMYLHRKQWCIFKFDMHERFPIVEHLQYHLPNQQMVLFDDDDDVQEVATQSAISKTMLMEWFKTNQESKVA